ncbi:MAG TPA: protein kinase [Kofleriaceae bacterium]
MTVPSHDIHAILSEVAEHPPARWPGLLAKRIPDDPSMVHQALLWLQANDHQDHGSDATPSLGELGDARYELAVQLDTGATASVWQAQDRKLGRTVAIKVFHRRGESELLHQVMAEARAACDVISDHVVRVLDVHEGGAHPYIVMELIGEHDPERGQLSLGMAASMCRPESLEEAVRWTMEVARGVHDAHLRNIFHRDLKPHNVLVTPISRRARVADFGLAVGAVGNERGTGTLSLVRRGPSGPVTVSGTPDFIAPEQARGLPLDLDPRSAGDRAVLVGIDVWGLGALAYDLVTGRPPWRASAEAESWELAASGEQPPRMERSVSGRRVPARLRRIVEKALAVDSHARYATAGQLANELAAFLSHRPTSHDRSRFSRVALWCRRNPRLTMTGLVAISLVALTLATRATVTRLRGERDALDEEVATQEAELHRVKTNIKKTRADLAQAAQQLAQVRSDLAAVEASLADERKTYQALIVDKDAALARANTATRRLVERVDQLRSELQTKQKITVQLDRHAASSLREAERLLRERDRARRERDIVRGERDGLRDERDAAVAEQEKVLRELERLRQELARLGNG